MAGRASGSRTAPFDLVDLARTLPFFPNHPTGDQLYTDQKFEAYGALGEQARMVGGVIRILLEEQSMPVKDAVRAVQDQLCALRDPTPSPPGSGPTQVEIRGGLDVQ